jgi:putative copper resistance protein D
VLDPLIIARAVHIAATAVMTGAVFFELAIARPVLFARTNRDAAKRYVAMLHRLIWAGLIVALVSWIPWALLIAARIAGTSIVQALGDGTFSTLLVETRFGHVWAIRVGLAGVIAAALLLDPRGGARWLCLIGALLFFAALAFVGHAGARPGAIGWLQFCADVTHLIAAGAWLGSLPALALLLANRSGIPPDLCAAATRRFSTFGVGIVAVLLASGAINAWVLTDSVAALTATAYGRLLLVKIALFVAMAGLAATNRWYWTPRLPAARPIRMIRRLSLTEAGLGLVVILVVGALGTLPPPVHQHLPTNIPAEAAFVHIHDIDAMADVSANPGRAGPTDISVRLMAEDFSQLAALTVSMRLTHPNGTSLKLDARRGPDGIWLVSGVPLNASGVWTIVIEASMAGGKSVSLDGPLVIEP